MKWENILKVQVLGNKQKVKMGNIPIPTEEDNSCKEELIAIYKKAESKFKSQNEGSHEIYGLDNIDAIPEEDCCAIVKFIQDYEPNLYFSIGTYKNKLKNNEYKTMKGGATKHGYMEISVECHQSYIYNENGLMSFKFMCGPTNTSITFSIEGIMHFPNIHGKAPIVTYSSYHNPGDITWADAFKYLDWRK